MNEGNGSFSQRFGYRAPDAAITVREDAPGAVREAITMLGLAFDVGPGGMRDLICEVLLKRPDPNNWSPGNVEHEVHYLMAEAPWYKVYDIAERLYTEVARNDYSGERQQQFSDQLNGVFKELGVGWQLENGKLVVRGSDAFNLAVHDAVVTMKEAGTPTASNEIHEAIKDISRRPAADVTGAIQHAMAALECVARDVDGTKDTLGKIINRLPLPAPLDRALHTLWGFASEQGRHIQEGRVPRFEEAELVVTIASAVSVYLLRHRASSGR
ncbi:hypothetical protein HW571_21850 [Agrobacterium genomosp. 3]|uniref:AbiJ-NTD4 domain-containing protein n=1 Tax=Agrobacterium tomkonis TaxID=1183410 RepID=UPI001CD8D70F|nr:hypothetical protein [Agrobacterium tomkonis]MCA1878691.1 hypothetical protein [Agrobacterium tumefaciens]MCA1893916.1 hypothetical protein [Agrobacterium tomkonis]